MTFYSFTSDFQIPQKKPFEALIVNHNCLNCFVKVCGLYFTNSVFDDITLQEFLVIGLNVQRVSDSFVINSKYDFNRGLSDDVIE